MYNFFRPNMTLSDGVETALMITIWSGWIVGGLAVFLGGLGVYFCLQSKNSEEQPNIRTALLPNENV